MSEDDRAGLSLEQVECFARGLYWLADLDGIVDSELKVIEEFLVETGSRMPMEALQVGGCDPRELPEVLETSHLRRLFLKAAIALVAADGKLTPREKVGLRRCARLFGLTDMAYEVLEKEALELSFEVPSVTSI